jgi:hypothetical protein
MSSSKHTKIKERQALALNIEAIGFQMPSCSTCERSGRKCIVADEKSSRCSECVRQGKACDVAGPSMSDWDALDRQEEKLDQEEEEAHMKIIRIKKQKKLLRARRKEMVRRGLRTLDELDAAERKETEQKEREEAEQLALAQTIPLPSSGDEVPVDPAFLPDSFWGDLGFVDGTAQATEGSA